MMHQKPKRWESKKYRDAARGQDCKLRFPGCRNETETVVLCHRPGAGMGMKSNDYDAADGCHRCHTILDGGYVAEGKSRDWTENYFHRARLETIINRIERGILK